MRYIPLLENTPPDEWIDSMVEKFIELITLDPEERNKFIDDNSTVWRDLSGFLAGLSSGKCWYSEAKEVFSYYHVDHFRPKKRLDDRIDFSQPVDYTDGYWWLAFDYTNYRLAGGVGNTYKKDKFAVIMHKANDPEDPIEDEVQYLLDPISEYDVKLLTFDETGSILPANPDVNSWDFKRAKYTIKVLKLEEHAPLKEARREIWEYCNRLLHDLATLMARQNISISASRKATIEEKFSELRRLRDPSKEFTMTVEACIKVFQQTT